MSEKIGRFEIISQLSQSSFATVYKALDTESQQTVALKVVRLDQVRDREALLKSVFDEAEQAKALSSHNIAVLYGVGDEGDQLLAATEYVQGNSVATTLARHEGFSIWDLQDVARQVCHALDHAQVHQVVHHSLEPAKIMVQWDGLVKVLGFGLSSMNSHAAGTPDAIPDVLYYASPEQLRGEVCDHRSALFSLGAVLYEMATEQKPFTGETAEQIREAILEKLPVQPVRLKANMNRGLSDLIMKVLSKNPDERYQSGQELVHDLEQCKASASPIGTAPATPAAPAKAVASPAKPKVSAAAASAFSGGKGSPPAPRISASAATPVVEEEKPHFSVDPMMAGEEQAGHGKSTSFSDISELPPLKEAPVDTSFHSQEPEPAEEAPAVEVPPAAPHKVEAEKPKVQVRAAAQKAVKEIRKTPPKLYLAALGGAVALIGIIVGGMMLKNYFEDRDQGSPTSAIQQITGAPADSTQPAPQPAPPAAPAPQQTETSQPQAAPEAAQPEAPQPEPPEPSGRVSRGRKGKSRAVAAAVLPAQLSVSSTPEGAEITFDGSALCQSPCTLTGIAPGAHTVVASKAGFSSATRNVSLASGANASIALQLAQSSAILTVSSTPAGAVIILDGADTGKLTPTQFTVNKPGTHTVTLRRAGYLDGSNSVNVELGQTSTVNLTLTHLGNTDEIRGAGGRFKKVFGHGDASGMGIVSVKTQPKGAQIMVNNRVLDKTSPFDFYLNPGTYVMDITMSGHRAIHRVITVQEGEKVAIEESLQPE
ncbi:MAG TPA: serine/threonine-protein kinase [Terriglobales bacterium]